MLLLAKSEKSVILLEEISSSQTDTESVNGSAATDTAFSHHHSCAPDEKFVAEGGKDTPGGVPKQLVFRDLGLSDEEAWTKADIEDEDVDVFCSAPALAISGLESECFTLSEIVRGKGL